MIQSFDTSGTPKLLSPTWWMRRINPWVLNHTAHIWWIRRTWWRYRDRSFPESTNFPLTLTSIPPWHNRPPPQYSLPIPPDNTLSPITSTARGFLRPDASRWKCSFVNPSSTGAHYQMFFSLTCCYPIYLLLLIYPSSWRPYHSLVYACVFYRCLPSSSTSIVPHLRFLCPHNSASPLAIAPHLYWHD